MLPYSVIICGIVRNAGPRFNRSMEIAKNIGSMFENSRIAIYENNSTDDTKERLAVSNPWWWLSERVVGADHPLKSVATSASRNVLMRHIVDKEKPDIFIWMDFDFVLDPNYDAIAAIFDRVEDWDAVFANGIDPDGLYWDWLAYRGWHGLFGPELIGDRNWYIPKQPLKLQDSKEWHRVLSAFGGCGIYKRDAILGCRYSARVTPDMEDVYGKFIDENQGNPQVLQYRSMDCGLSLGGDVMWKLNSGVTDFVATCDHVAMHASMIKNGYSRLFVVPDFTWHYGDRKYKP